MPTPFPGSHSIAPRSLTALRGMIGICFCLVIFSSILLAPIVVPAAGINDDWRHSAGLPAPDSIPGLRRTQGSLRFIGMGDWGRRGAPAQLRVAAAMASVAGQLGIRFVIATGDNFYENGVDSVNDPQFKESFRDVYDQPALQVPWFPVLGNHDYNLDPQAQVDYSRVDPRWRMKARYYDTSYLVGTDSLLLVFLDTYPMEKHFLGSDTDTSKFPRGGVDLQLNWLQEVLSSSKARWKIVVGHNPPHTGGSRRHSPRTRKFRRLLEPVFHRNGVDLYLSGHEHHLEYLEPAGPTHYIISGAASESRHVGWLKRFRRFGARKKGFVIFSLTDTQLLFQFVDENARILYTGSIEK